VHAWLTASEAESSTLIDFIRTLAAAESPSLDRAALDACASVLIARLTSAGAKVERRPGDASSADHVVARWPGNGRSVLLLTHFDTVYPRGQLTRQPLEIKDGRLFGPGVYDMKAGLAMAVTAAALVASRTESSARPSVTLLATSDEEVGSGSSRSVIEAMSREHDAVLVFEPATASGGVKTARKGVGEFEVVATGIASHAGVAPEQGASAIHELAAQIARIQSFADPARGLTINVGVIEGGSRSNVVAESARALVDVRITRLEDAAQIEEQLRALAPVNPRVTLRVTGGINRPPMERSAGVAGLYERARALARRIGWDLTEGSTGGGSDGNFSAALGVPTLDGLGATGDGAHARHEHIIIKDLPIRTALAAALIESLGDNGFVAGGL
jgi:glutamate carboxypeptidase